MLDGLDPLHGLGYDFWSGIGSGSPVFVIAVAYWRRHNCHVRGCWRLQFHSHPDHGHPVCRRHWPQERLPADLIPEAKES